MSIQSILDHKGSYVVKIPFDDSVKHAADLMCERKIAALVVVEGRTIVSVVSERDIVLALSRFEEAALSRRVYEITNRDMVAIAPDDGLKSAMSLMTRYRVRHLPVIEKAKLIGIVSIGDVVKHRLDELELEANVLRDIYFATH